MKFGFESAFGLADIILEALLRNDNPGLVLSIDIGGSFFDVVATNAAEAVGWEIVRSPTFLSWRAYLESMPKQMRAANVIAEPEFFGRVDGFLRSSGPADPIASDETGREPVPTRSIDGWMAGRPPLRLIHLGDTELNADLLAGATATIVRDRPVLTLYSARQDRAALLSRLDSLGYQTLDLTARPVQAEKDKTFEEFGWIAVPREKQTIIQEATATIHERLSSSSVWELEHDAGLPALPRQRRARSIFGLPLSAFMALGKSIPAKDIISISDVYPLESENGHSWRWLGPRPCSRVALPCPAPGRYNIELEILGSQLENKLADCRVIVEGREVVATASDSLPGGIAFVGQAEAADYAGYLEVAVVSAGKVLPPARNEPRTLRISVRSIQVSPFR
ncbi:MAG TPA: hypothetical protein VMF66_03250 [Candidatus Acidoferrum sp.]|nr:hypothetical protein [Candidatus Acidoferrum sp.]